MSVNQFLPIIFIALILGSCKTVGGGNLQALHQFQANSEAPVVCTGDVMAPKYEELFASYWKQPGQTEASAPIDARDDYKDIIKPILAAVPMGLHEWFFTKGGRLLIRGDLEKWCNTGGAGKFVVHLVNAKGEHAGCVTDKESNGGLPNINISVKSTELDGKKADVSNLVQGFAVITSFVASRLDPNVSVDPKGTLTMRQLTVSESDARLNLGFFMTDDLVNAKVKDSGIEIPKGFTQLLSDKNIWDANVSRDKRYAAIWNSRNSDETRNFLDFALAQALDSDWCHEDTRALFKGPGGLFVQTGKQFYETDMQANMNEDLAAITEEAEANNAVSSPSGNSANENATSGDKAPEAGDGSFSLFPFPNFRPLRAVINARPLYAVGHFFKENRPVRTVFAKYQPVRRVAARIKQASGRVVHAVFPGNRCWKVRRGRC